MMRSSADLFCSLSVSHGVYATYGRPANWKIQIVFYWNFKFKLNIYPTAAVPTSAVPAVASAEVTVSADRGAVL